MEFTGEIDIPAPREVVFQKLRDARFFASCIEGVSDLEELDEMHYKAVLATRIAYIKFKFALELELIEVSFPTTVVAKSEGKPMGMIGRLTSTARLDLVDKGDACTLKYMIEMALTGKMGSLGQPVMRSKAKEMEKSFAANIRAEFATDSKAVP